MFQREGGDSVEGSMLTFTIHTIMDFSSDRTGSSRMIGSEVVSQKPKARRENCSANFSA
jgi:hypothetical protein